METSRGHLCYHQPVTNVACKLAQGRAAHGIPMSPCMHTQRAFSCPDQPPITNQDVLEC